MWGIMQPNSKGPRKKPRGVTMAEEANDLQEADDVCCLAQLTQDADERIRRQLEVNVAYYARRLDRIEERLQDLEKEWDAERTVAVGAGAASLVGLALGLFNRRWALLPVAAAALLIAHAADGCCAQLPVLRCLGVRTRREIDEERFALKALRGDFSAVTPGSDADPETNAARAIDGVQRD
jgi:hypothetical protein